MDYSLSLEYEDISTEAIDRGKQLFLDFLGVATGGRSLSESFSSILEGVDELGSGTTGRCAVLGESRLYPAHYAALLNGAMAHSIDFDDIHSEAHIHPAAPLFPALMAVAEEKKASGREFLTAAIAGYDVMCKLGKAHGNLIHKRRLHPTSTTGIFGVTIAAGALMGLDRNKILNAVALNLSQTAGSQQFLETGGWNKPVQVGLTAHNAIYSLVFARRGFQGSSMPLEGSFGYFPTYVVDGYDLGLATAGLGQEFEVLRTAVKPYPCCRYSHTTIDGVIDAMNRKGLKAKDIRKIDINLSGTGYSIVAGTSEVKRRPKTIVDAQFSVFFAAAIAVLEGNYTWQSHDRIHDPEVAAIADKTEVSPSKELDDWASRVTIRTRSGDEHTVETFIAKGEPEKPLGWAELEAKFHSLWRTGSFRGGAEEVIGQIKGLEKLSDFGQFTSLLRGGN